MPDELDLGDVLKKLRELRELTQAQLAKKTGLPVNTIHRYENDYKDRIPPDRLELIAKALDVTVPTIYQYKQNPSMLEDPATFYGKKSKSKVSVIVELDGTIDTLNTWVTTLKKLNAAI